MELIWYTAMSMDGRIAGAGDAMGFLDAIDHEGEPDDEFESFLAGIDAVLVGGGTMRWLVGNGHGWPHGDLPTWLVSSDELLLAAIGPTPVRVERRTGDLGPVLDEIEAAGHERVWIAGGGSVAGQVLALDRLDEVIATIGPTMLGAGPSLVDVADLAERRFVPTEVRRYGSSAVRVSWRRDRTGAPR